MTDGSARQAIRRIGIPVNEESRQRISRGLFSTSVLVLPAWLPVGA